MSAVITTNIPRSDGLFVVMTADIAHTLHPHRQLLVAFSGGLDSTVLLHLPLLANLPTVRHPVVCVGAKAVVNMHRPQRQRGIA
jgi:predicted phosphoadenosine phosphosulfate sulfurtransferase